MMMRLLIFHPKFTLKIKKPNNQKIIEFLCISSDKRIGKRECICLFNTYKLYTKRISTL